MEVRGRILGRMEIRKCSQNRYFRYKPVFLAPKVCSRRGSEKNMKNQRKMDGKMRGFGMLKPLKTMPCAMNSRLSAIQKKLENRCQNGSQKSWKIYKNRPLGCPRSIYSSILWIMGCVEKSMFFDVALGRPKIEKNRHKGRRKVAMSSPAGIRGEHFVDRGW